MVVQKRSDCVGGVDKLLHRPCDLSLLPPFFCQRSKLHAQNIDSFFPDQTADVITPSSTMSLGVSFAENDEFFEQDGAGYSGVAQGAAQAGSSIFCPNCGGREIEQQDASGASVCMDCGVVVEENAIVSSVEFVEGAGGASSMVGQFVSATSSKAYTTPSSNRPGRRPFSRDSRETTLNNGRRRIQEIASRLRLSNHYIDAAHRLFTIAVEKNFVQGRRTTHVVATCLYIVCRQEKSQHMLIDFSDALQVNVYTLGTCFLKYRRLLGLKLEIIDPALYVYRFAAHLDLEEKANAVSLTALRLVARMKRDWIVAGRRPAGICAAALLIAARAHGFKKHHQDVTRILRVCGMTVTSRVREFELTPAANLTLDEFQSVEIESEADPPVYTRNKIYEARIKAIHDGNVKLLESGALDDPREGPRKAHMWRTPDNITQRDKDLRILYRNLEQELIGDKEKGGPKKGEQPALESEKQNGEEKTDQKEADKSKPEKDQKSAADSDSTTNQLVTTATEGVKAAVPEEWKRAYPRGGSGRYLIPPDQATKEEMQAPIGQVETKLNITEWKETMPESMDAEFDDIFRTEEEEMQKAAIFNKINKDYLEQQERKDSLKRENEKAAEQADDDAAQAEGHARYRGRKNKRKKGGEEGEETTEEQLRAAVAGRKVSRKINYDALSSIFDDDGSLGNVDASGGPGEESMEIL